MAIFNVFGIGYYRSICRCLRYKSLFKLHNTANSAECLIDTRGSGFSLKTASVVGLLFGSFHLSLMRSSDEHQNSDIICNEGSKVEKNYQHSYQHSEAVGWFSEMQSDHKESYVARVLKRTLEQSLMSLIKSATAKVRFALDNCNSGCQLSHCTATNRTEDVAEQREGRNITLDDLVKNAIARKEINKIIRVIDIGRGEKEIQDHPLLPIAEATAHYLMRQMDYVEA
uniref:Receptor-type adenylate cyclase n=1 Tax=Loa loa TaxID=7209 RepID=A0A1I7V6D1_LOALO